jgi:carbon monoxide dehydrogenase subunit G
MRVERNVLLPTTRADAWAILLDWERQADWMRDADRVEVVTLAREGPGVLIAVKTRVLNIPAFTERLEVLEWKPPARLLMAHRSFIRGTGEWLLEEVEGGTRFTWIEQIQLPWGPLGDLALSLYRPVMRWLMDRAMQDLRQFVIAAGPS